MRVIIICVTGGLGVPDAHEEDEECGGLGGCRSRGMPLAEAAEAHRRLQSRQTTGSTVLLP